MESDSIPASPGRARTPRLLFGAFLTLWVLSLVWYGAVSAPAVATIAVGTALLWAAAVALLPGPPRPLFSTFLVTVAALAVVLLQLVPLPAFLFPFTAALRARHGVAGNAPGTGDLYLTLKQLAGLGACALAGLFVKRLVDAGLKRMDVVAGVVAVLALEGVYAVLQVGLKFKDIPFYGERPYLDCASGTLVNRNHFAGLVAIGLVFAFAAAWARFTSPRRSNRGIAALEGGLPWALAAALFASCQILARSRGGALGAGAGVVALAFLVRRRGAAVSVLAAVLLACLGAAAVWAANVEPLVERFETIDPDRAGSDTRVKCWEASLDGWKKQPVLGFGIGTFPETFRPFQPPSLPGQFQHAHNEYVTALFEGGVAWLALLLAAFGLWLWRAVKGLRRLEGSERAAAAACIAAAVAIAVHSVVDFDLRITAVALAFAAALGAALPFSSSARPAPRLPALLPALAVAAAALPLWFAGLEPGPAALAASVREPADAEVRLADILRRSPYDAVAASVQAMQAERRDDLALAAQRLETAADLWPANPDFQRDAALWFLDHDDPARADPCFRRAFEQRPSALAAVVAPLWSAADPVAPWLNRLPTPRTAAAFAAFLARRNRWGEAATVFAKGVPAEEPYVAEYDTLAAAFHDAGQWGLEAALRDRRLSIRSDPDAHAAAAAAWARVEAWDKALEHARIAIRIDPGRADWQVQLAEVLEAKGEGMQAIEALTEAVRIKPDDTGLRLRRAGLYSRQKLFPLAVEDCRAVMKAAPANREAAMGLVDALAAAGQKIEALAAVEKWLEAHPEDVRAGQVRDALRK